MKKLALLLTLFIPSLLISQSCLPEGITFTTQAQIDSFQILYPNCTEIDGNVKIGGYNIMNLDSLISISEIGGSLLIGYYYMRPDGGYNFAGNPNLTSIQGLQSLESIGESLQLYGNDSLTELSGLENLKTIDGSLLIGTMVIDGWGGISFFGNAIEDISALSNLESIDGGISIRFNNLSSLEGLNNIDPNTISYLRISSNQNLSHCEIQNLCDYIEGADTTYIDGNATGCNTVEEVVQACESLSIDEAEALNCSSIFPNPFTTSSTISYDLTQSSTVTITFFNHLGKQVDFIQINQSKGKQQITWNAESQPVGIYYFRLQAGEQTATGKLLLVR